ncbi:MAG: hypothetical protein IT169_15895 [Bryobacterales bacterium]|nr:hypothetical protein [Bryobacterales bacterium]
MLLKACSIMNITRSLFPMYRQVHAAALLSVILVPYVLPQQHLRSDSAITSSGSPDQPKDAILHLEKETAEIAAILTITPTASPIFSIETILHLIDEGKIADEDNRTSLLVTAFRRASSVEPALPLACRSCGQGTLDFALVAASQGNRNALSLKTAIISRLQTMDPPTALALTEDLSSDGSLREAWERPPEPPLFYDTRAFGHQMATILIRNRRLIPSDKDFRAHLFAALSALSPALRVRTLGHFLLMSRGLSDSLAADLRSQILVDLPTLKFESLKQEDFDFTLLTILQQLSDRFPNDPSFHLNWAMTYANTLFSGTRTSGCTAATNASAGKASIVPGDPADPIEAHRSPVEELDYTSYFISAVARPLGLPLPKKERLDAIQACFSSLPREAATPIEMPPGASGLLRPLFRYKEAVFSPSASSTARDSLIDADAAVSRYLGVLSSGGSISDEKPQVAFLSHAAAFMVLTNVLSDEVWFSGAWEAYVDFMDRSDKGGEQEFLWLGQIAPMVALTSRSEPSEDELLRKSRGKGLVPSFVPLGTRRHEAIATLKRARSTNLRLLGAIQEVAPFRYTIPREMRVKLEQ